MGKLYDKNSPSIHSTKTSECMQGTLPIQPSY